MTSAFSPSGSIFLVQETVIKNAEKIAERNYKLYKFGFIMIIVLYFGIIALITHKVGWDKMEPITYFLSAIGFIAAYIYSAISGNSFNPIKHFEQKKTEFINKSYKDFNFNSERFENLIVEENELKEEILKLKNGTQ